MVYYFLLSIIREKNISQSNSESFLHRKSFGSSRFISFIAWKFTLLLMKCKIFLKAYRRQINTNSGYNRKEYNNSEEQTLKK